MVNSSAFFAIVYSTEGEGNSRKYHPVLFRISISSSHFILFARMPRRRRAPKFLRDIPYERRAQWLKIHRHDMEAIRLKEEADQRTTAEERTRTQAIVDKWGKLWRRTSPLEARIQCLEQQLHGWEGLVDRFISEKQPVNRDGQRYEEKRNENRAVIHSLRKEIQRETSNYIRHGYRFMPVDGAVRGDFSSHLDLEVEEEEEEEEGGESSLP
jgi:hypothetical protein